MHQAVIGFLPYISASQLVLTGASPVASDSAGVKIVLNRGIAVERTVALGSDPILRIGTVMGGPAEFEDVVAAVRRSDGSVVVADRGRGAVIAFGPSGEHLWTYGRRGQGPHEFARGAPTAMWRWRHDTTVVWDRMSGRVVWVDASGAYARDWRVPRGPARDRRGVPIPSSFPQALGFLNDHQLLMQYTDGRPDTEGRSPGDRTRATVDLAVLSDGGPPRPIGAVPDRTWFFFRWRGSMTNDTLPLGPKGLVTVAPNRWYHSDGARYGLGVFDGGGKLTASFRVEAPHRASSSRVEEFKARRMRDAPQGQEAFWRRWLDGEIPFPTQLPALDRLLVDESGNVWARLTPEELAGSTHWLVFGTAGILMAQVELPPRFDPLHVSHDTVLGLWKDPLDVQFLFVYALMRTP